MTPMRVAVQIQPQHATYSAIRQAAAEAEAMGVDVIYNWDHFFPLRGGSPDPHDGAHFECWTMLGAWAEQTSRVRIGALVTCNSYRNPQLLADMARTVDHISNGRLILGIGSGWFEKDYDEYGYSFGTAGNRLRDLDGALPLITGRLAQLEPPPTRKIPILIGGGGEKVTLRLVAEHADIWHWYGDVATIDNKSRILDEWCERVGRNPADIERSIGVNHPRLAGETPEHADDLAALGVTEVMIGVSGPDLDLSSLEPWLTWRDDHNSTLASPGTS